jgi:hypothetical protein
VDDPFRIAAKESRMPTIKLKNHDVKRRRCVTPLAIWISMDFRAYRRPDPVPIDT